MDIIPDKRKDQHFLMDDTILRKIVSFADIHPDEEILEIGAGPGNLTTALSKKARRVYSVEIDSALVAMLEEKFKDSNVTIIKGNALKVDLPRFDKVVANLPYSISSDITFRLLERPFKFGILMYQREFAQRMVAKVGEEDYSRLSVHVQHYADVEILMRVPPHAFNPPPEVGLSEQLQGLGVKLIDLNAEPHVEVDVPGGRSLKKVTVAKSFIDYDCILSVPKLKIHCWSLSTLSMKNMMGGILPKGIMHDDLAQKIVDLNRAFGPELTVIDGIIGCQGHELACDPINSEVIIAGEDFVATDAVGSFLMGLCPEEIPYLQLAKKAGLGENDMEKIEYVGEQIGRIRKKYRM